MPLGHNTFQVYFEDGKPLSLVFLEKKKISTWPSSLSQRTSESQANLLVSALGVLDTSELGNSLPFGTNCCYQVILLKIEMAFHLFLKLEKILVRF